MTQASEDHRSRPDKRSKRRGNGSGDTVRWKTGLRRLRQMGMDRHNTHEDHDN